jgi:antitoxin component of RelBE/YafQ-DinJ toxin-antitoxin module
MALERIHLSLEPAHLRRLDRLAAKLGLDRSNALRYCIARAADAEGIPPEKLRS